MMKKALACTMLLGVVCSLPAAADDGGLKFKGGIGVHPISGATPIPPATQPPTTPSVTTVNRNIVRGVYPANQVWVIDKLDATVGTGGSITVKGNGLVLGGGNNAGRAPTPALFVIATLICDTTTFTQFSSSPAGVALSPTGDFTINDTLAPLPPAACSSPMLLIRNAATAVGGAPNPWFAVGIYRPPGSSDD